MKIIVPPITRPVRLTDYAPEMVRDDGEPITVWVWVNPPARMIDEMQALRARSVVVRDQLQTIPASDLAPEIKAISADVSRWYAAIWSQHADPATHWTAEDVLALDGSETDPALGGWLKGRTWDAINAHRSAQKKA